MSNALRRAEDAPHVPSMRQGFSMVALALVYMATAKGGLMLGAVSGFASLVWPPTGIALATLMLAGTWLWPAVAMGAFLVNVVNGASIPVAMGIATGNTLEAVLGAYLLTKWASPFSLSRVRDVVYLVAAGAIASTVVSALIGVASLFLGGQIGASDVVPTFRAWWMGDALANIVLTPVLLSFRAPADPPLRRHLPEVTLLVLSTASIAVLIFFNRPTAPFPAVRMPFMLFPFFTWAALRLGINGAMLTTLLVSVLAITGTTLGLGPYVRESLSESLTTLQTYMGVVGATMLLFGAAISERLRAIRAREEILAVVSHDLKNPLSSIRLSAAQLLKFLPEEGRAAKARSSVRIVERSVHRMEHLIRDLLDLATLDTGHLTLACDDVELGTIVHEAAEMIRSLAEGKLQSLRVTLADEDGSTLLKCDHERVLQVLSNLLGNAVKFTPERGQISLRAKPEEQFVRFWVEDTGVGVPSTQLRHVFDRYWKARPAQQDGSGLGLSIAKGIVTAHGGRIWATSVVGKGSTFCFTLPIEGPPDQTPPSPS